MRDALLDAQACTGGPALGRLATAMTATIRRPAHAEGGPPGGAMLDRDRSAGPWLGYLLRPDASGWWLALGWQPPREAAAVRAALPLEIDDRFRLGPIGMAPESLTSVLLWVAYDAAALPPEHQLLNDLHAMVMIRDLLSESAPAGC